MKDTLLFLYLVFAVAVSQIEECDECSTEHPQQQFCKSDFAVRVEILQIDTGSTQGLNTITAHVIDGMKLGKKKSGQIIDFYSSASRCGGTFLEGRQYVITGRNETWRNGTTYLLHTFCDFAKEWDDLSPQQQKGFTKKYARFCDCQIESPTTAASVRVQDLIFENNYPNARTYWTPDLCYFNPHKSSEFDSVEDCEEKYGFCAPVGDGECGWQLTPEYEKCFNFRDDYVLLSDSVVDSMDPKQCNLIPSRRKRRKCRKMARKYTEMLPDTEIEIPLLF